MNELWANFLGYLSLYKDHMVPIFILGIFFTAIIWTLIKRGSIKYTGNPFRTLFCGCILSFSVAVIIIMTLYGRTPGTEYALRLRLFGSYREAFGNRNIEILLQIIMNIVMFVPVGLFLPCCFQKFERNRFVVFGAFFLSGAIEIIQGITRIGMFEFDDILGNVLGAEIGFGIYWIVSRIFRKVKWGRKRLLRIIWGFIAVMIVIWGISWCMDKANIPETYIEESNFSVDAYTYSRTKSLEIRSTEEWIDFSNDVRNGMDYSDYTVYLMEDLDFEYVEETMPVGDKENPFRGSLYGNNHIISNLKLSSEEEYVGLFGVTEYALIQDLSLQNCDIESFYATGTGGIVGFAQKSKIEDCVFNGKLFANNGSVGGIIGNNHSLVYQCTVYGDILGNVQNGIYRTEWTKASYGTGGITGDNGNIIFQCENYADVFDNSEEHESNTLRSGGISGYNNGRIASCVNYGKVTGGGITENNSKYGIIRCCFNLGEVYSGISVGSYQDSVIEYCVNLGQAEGRYAGDIVSFWGQDSEENRYGHISNCLYINAAKSGTARKKSFGTDTLYNNSKIKMPDDKSMAQFSRYMETNEHYNAYRFLEEKRNEGRRDLLFKIFLSSTISFFIVFGIIKIKKWKSKNGLYRRGVSAFEEKSYWKSYKLLCECQDYKNSKNFLEECIHILLMEGREKGILQLGECMGKTIEWNKMKEEHGSIYFLSTNALAVERIHMDTKMDKWEDSELSKKLNSVYKEKWFGRNIDSYLEIDISIPEIEDIKERYPSSQERQCKNFYKIEGTLRNAEYVYWWLRSSQQVEKMPFVTADGLISEKGKLLTDTNIAVRPMIKIRGVYEKNS